MERVEIRKIPKNKRQSCHSESLIFRFSDVCHIFTQFWPIGLKLGCMANSRDESLKFC